MTVDRLGRLTGTTPLKNRREEDVRRVIFALTRLTYETGRADAMRELEALFGL